jgi:hypothetical protein
MGFEDEVLKGLKKQRLKLKDDIATQLRNAECRLPGAAFQLGVLVAQTLARDGRIIFQRRPWRCRVCGWILTSLAALNRSSVSLNLAQIPILERLQS